MITKFVHTGKPEAPRQAIAAGLGFDGLFEAVSGGDSLPVKKPDPEHPLGLLEALDAAPGSAVMLGGSRNDVLAAQAAGLPADRDRPRLRRHPRPTSSAPAGSSTAPTSCRRRSPPSASAPLDSHGSPALHPGLRRDPARAHSSAGERLVHTEEVRGSIPRAPTIFFNVLRCC